MNILQVSPFYPPHVGGIEHYVETLSKKLTELGHKVTVFTSNVPRSKEFEKSSNLEIHRFKPLFSLMNNQFVPQYFLKLIDETSFDIIHAHGYLHFSSNAVALSKLFNDKPAVLTTHGISAGYTGLKKVIESVYNLTIGRFSLKLFNKIIALSSEEANFIKRLKIDHDKIEIVPNGIDLDQINLKVDCEEFKRKYKLDGTDIILFVGSLIPRKGLGYLISAMQYIKPTAILLIVGGELQSYPGMKRALELKAIKLGLEKRILFLGRLSKAELEKAYCSADIFVLPSLSEGFPLVLLEAMSYGKCVVTSNIPSFTSIIQNDVNGILFEVKNSKDLAQKINYLLENPYIRKKLGKRARREVERKYRLDIIIRRILSIYRDVINSI